MRYLGTFVVLLVLGGLGTGGFFVYQRYSSAEPIFNYRTATVTRGDLVSTITATGILQPEDVLNVGAQVMGRIEDFGIDFEAEKRLKLPASAAASAVAGSEHSEAPHLPNAMGQSAPPGTPLARPSSNAARAAPVPATGIRGSSAASLAVEDPDHKRPRIDYGSIVHPDTILAYIDPLLYEAQVRQATANLRRAEADLLQLKAKIEQTRNDWNRAQKLHQVNIQGGKFKGISDADYDLAKANYRMAEAYYAVGEAALEQAKAALERDETNLKYTIIKSPVKGVVITRRVNIGQTVVASLNAPSLFLIAKDLKRMQVWALVNEADIGRVHQGMKVRFTVDTYPGETFEGEVLQVRLNADSKQNVTLYTVVVKTENPDGRLLPYLTANLKFEVEKHPNVLKVPNAALRWKPRPQQIHPDERPTKGEGKADKRGGDQATPGKPADKTKTPAEKPAKPAQAKADQDQDKVAKEPGERGKLWLKDGNYVRPVEVTVGDTDGTFTEVSGTKLQENMDVVVGEEPTEQAGGGGGVLGVPQFRKKR